MFLSEEIIAERMKILLCGVANGLEYDGENLDIQLEIFKMIVATCGIAFSWWDLFCWLMVIAIFVIPGYLFPILFYATLL